MMDPLQPQSNAVSRRWFFRECGVGVGKIALASLLAEGAARAATTPAPAAGPARGPHFPAKAKRVIYLFMAGGPSQLDLFDFKPVLQARAGEPIPESFIKGKPFAQITEKQPSVAVVVLSMHADESYVLRALKAGARGRKIRDDPFSVGKHRPRLPRRLHDRHLRPI